MDLKEIMAIAGKPGLFQMVAQSKNGIVVESLLDGKRFTAFAHERISSLEEISIYTDDEELALKDIFKRIYEKHEGGQSLDSKSDKNTLRSYFMEVVPEHDQERVYTSDIKKMISWYNLLAEKEMLDFTEEETDEETLKRVLMTNVELFERLLELHEFLDENDLTQKDFQRWKNEKYERNYH